MKKNVLVTGIGQTNYIFQLYENITPRLNKSFVFNSLNLRIKSQGDKYKADNIFYNNYKIENNLSLITRIGILFSLFLHKKFWSSLFLTLYDNEFTIVKLMNILNVHIYAKHIAKFIDNNTNTHIIHNHFPVLHTSCFINYLKKNYTIIQSFWGSDIYRMNDIQNIYFQKTLLSKSDWATVTTPEMKFSVITKFGINFNHKIFEIKFISNEDFYYLVDNKNVNKNLIKSYYNIPTNKIIIAFGHNANPANNHIKFIHSILNSNQLDLNKYHFVFPCTYGDYKNERINNIKNLCEGIINYTIIKDYMTVEELVKLKSIIDLYIHMPTTDGLSAFLTEFFYLNKPCIVASWLPYDAFKNVGIKYIECNNFDDIPNKIRNYLDYNFEDNKTIVKETFFKEAIIPEWIKFYNLFINH